MGLDNPIHLALLLVVMLLLFGAKRLPEMGRSLGDGLRGFKDAVSGTPVPQIDTAATEPPVPTHVVATQPAVQTHIVATQPAVPAQSVVAEPQTTTAA